MAETAVLRVLGDILLALHREEFAALTVLDLPAAFNAVDHATLLIRLYIPRRSRMVFACRRSRAAPSLVR